MGTKEVLIAAKALIDTPEKWTQGAFYHGQSRCALMAFMSIEPPGCETPARDLFRRANGICDISVYNDTHTHAQVMAAFDRAIEAAS